jgi:hypothetical protein
MSTQYVESNDIISYGVASSSAVPGPGIEESARVALPGIAIPESLVKMETDRIGAQ